MTQYFIKSQQFDVLNQLNNLNRIKLNDLKNFHDPVRYIPLKSQQFDVLNRLNSSNLIKLKGQLKS